LRTLTPHERVPAIQSMGKAGLWITAPKRGRSSLRDHEASRSRLARVRPLAHAVVEAAVGVAQPDVVRMAVVVIAAAAA